MINYIDYELYMMIIYACMIQVPDHRIFIKRNRKIELTNDTSIVDF